MSLKLRQFRFSSNIVFTLFLLVSILFIGSSCSGTAEGDCEKVAQKQCELWNSCKCNNKSCTSENHTYPDTASCVKVLTASCRAAAASINDSDGDVGECKTTVESMTCEILQNQVARGQGDVFPQCHYFY